MLEKVFEEMTEGPLNIEIAGVNFAVSCRDADILLNHDPAYESFFRAERDPSTISVDIVLQSDNMPDTGSAKKIFDSGQSWFLFSDDAGYYLVLDPPGFQGGPIWVARFDRDAARVNVHCRSLLTGRREGRPAVVNPLCYPLDQLLLMYVLARRGGAIVHSAGVAIGGKGYIFPGRSGAGKSTLMRQFLGLSNAELLSDDRVVVRKTEQGFLAFGTPWPGEAAISINGSVTLCGIFFISHGTDNLIEALDRKEALERLLPLVSISWYDPGNAVDILEFCAEMISGVPAYEFSFSPGEDAANAFAKFVSS